MYKTKGERMNNKKRKRNYRLLNDNYQPTLSKKKLHTKTIQIEPASKSVRKLKNKIESTIFYIVKCICQVRKITFDPIRFFFFFLISFRSCHFYNTFHFQFSLDFSFFCYFTFYSNNIAKIEYIQLIYNVCKVSKMYGTSMEN